MGRYRNSARFNDCLPMNVPAVIDEIEPSLRVLLTPASPLGHMTIFLDLASPLGANIANE